MRRVIIAANWKMHKTIDEGLSFISELKDRYPKTHPVKVVVCAPFTMLFPLAEKAIGSGISIGAQNLYWEEKGAFTGEISAAMIVDAGCEYVVVGHSERRTLFGETDEWVNCKIRAALKKSLKVIFCLGETLAQRENGDTFEVIEHQLLEGLKDLNADSLKDLVIAYEPVWAIGTGRTATPEQAGEVHQFIRTKIATMYHQTAADEMRILYGGSVKPANVDQLMAVPDIDGALVGGASLEVDSFLRLINFETIA